MLPSTVPINIIMINPVNSTSAKEATQQTARPPQPPAQPPVIRQDTVTLKSAGDKSAGDPDHDGK